MGYGLVSAALVVTAGRVGDMFGRVRMFKIGFVVFTAAAVGLRWCGARASAAPLEIIAFRMIQAVGGAMMMANSAAILTDAFPARSARHGPGHQRRVAARRVVHWPHRWAACWLPSTGASSS